ncbi:MAG: hypothetical protein OXN83_00725, partial [Oligoflexia bacterium]|nr:hypothetical protein [Oligoflexia bacterium]
MKPLALFLVIFPQLAFSFSETELESLETEGTKTFSKSPWRRDMGLSLIRNLEIETRHRSFLEEEKNQDNKSGKANFCEFNKKDSLCDLSSLFYKLDFTLYYSLAQWAEKYFNNSFLKNTEFFLGGYFMSSIKPGLCLERKGYNNFMGYIKCGVSDMTSGWTTLIYKKDSFFSYFNFSMLVWPLSQKSKDVTLKTAFNSSISTLYFLKKQEKWSGAISSNHSLSYNHFTSPIPKKATLAYNNPFDTSQQLSLIFKQNFNKYLPANTALFISYNLALDTYKTYWVKHHIEKHSHSYLQWGGEKYKEDIQKCPSKTHLKSVIACGNRWQHLSLGL